MENDKNVKAKLQKEIKENNEAKIQSKIKEDNLKTIMEKFKSLKVTETKSDSENKGNSDEKETNNAESN